MLKIVLLKQYFYICIHKPFKTTNMEEQEEINCPVCEDTGKVQIFNCSSSCDYCADCYVTTQCPECQ